MKERMPAVAGQFYPGTREELERMLRMLFRNEQIKQLAYEAIVPHAGYIYSGKVAAKVFAKIKKAETFVILSPNHTGLGSEISVSESASWVTPLGELSVNIKLAEEIVSNSSANFDELAHIEEHSIEVLLPFIQHLFKKASIVPITIGTTSFDELDKLAEALFKASQKHKFCLIASSDFSHFVPLKFAKEKDMEAIEYIKRLDAEGFYNIVAERRLSICGHAPITTTLIYCKKRGRREGRLLKYDTSASRTGDTSNVVGYAGIIFL